MSATVTWAAAAATVVILGLYELSFAWLERRRPLRIARSAHAAMREDWFTALSAHSGSEILSVQTLRNSLMSATMVTSTAALGLVATVTISASALHANFDVDSGAWQALSPRLALELILLGMLAASLISSAIAARFYNHAGFITSMPVGSTHRARWSPLGVKYLRRAGVLYAGVCGI